MSNKGYERKCGAPDCTRENRTGGLCMVHITIRDEGLPMAETVWVARRLANVEWVGECLIWRGQTNNKGYGKVGTATDPGAAGNEEAVHRWFYRRIVGPIPDGLVLDHLCRTPLCVNVKHLEPVTLAENTRRGAISRGFTPERSHCARGHERTAENLFAIDYAAQPGRRPALSCRLCRNQTARERRERIRNEAKEVTK